MSGFADNLTMRVGANVRKVEFFTSALMKKVEDANRKNLGLAGGMIRKIAVQSMKTAPSDSGGRTTSYRDLNAGYGSPAERRRASAPPGSPPLSHKAHPWLKRHLYYAYDPISRSVVVGPALLGGDKATGAPEVLEYGGQTRIKNPLRRVRKLGDGGEIELHSPSGYPRKTFNGGTVMVRYAKLKTERMVARANRFNEQLYGPLFKRTTIQARPFMRPALDTAEDRLVDIWKDTIVGVSVL